VCVCVGGGRKGRGGERRGRVGSVCVSEWVLRVQGRRGRGRGYVWGMVDTVRVFLFLVSLSRILNIFLFFVALPLYNFLYPFLINPHSTFPPHTVLTATVRTAHINCPYSLSVLIIPTVTPPFLTVLIVTVTVTHCHCLYRSRAVRTCE
jgi:hypothetical protein